MKITSFIAAVGAASTFGSALAAEGLPHRNYLPQALAQQMVTACLAHQSQTGYAPINVFVVDTGGVVLAAAKQDGACLACNGVAEAKAVNSATTGFTTRMIADLSFGLNRDGVNAFLPGAPFVPGNVAFAGGMPVTNAKSQVIGGIGVSGASPDEDEACAQAGLDQIASFLN